MGSLGSIRSMILIWNRSVKNRTVDCCSRLSGRDMDHRLTMFEDITVATRVLSTYADDAKLLPATHFKVDALMHFCLRFLSFVSHTLSVCNSALSRRHLIALYSPLWIRVGPTNYTVIVRSNRLHVLAQSTRESGPGLVAYPLSINIK